MLRLVEDFELDFVAGGQDPTEEEVITITAPKPKTATVTATDGSVWSYQFYSDKIALVQQDGGPWTSWYYTVTTQPSSSGTGPGNPPSVVTTTTSVYSFTGPAPTDGTGDSGRTGLTGE